MAILLAQCLPLPARDDESSG